MFKQIKNSILGVTAAVGFVAALCAPAPGIAADFPVAVKRLSVTQCTMTGSLLNIDSATGNVSIDLGSDFNCYPSPVNLLANNASLSVTSATTIGGGTTGAGQINVTLNTGLATTTPGVTCVPDGHVSSNVNVTSGWSTALCGPSNCGPQVARQVQVQNPSPTVDGSITLKAKCTYQDQTNANLTTERKNINSTPLVTVLHGTAPPPEFCASVSELSNTYGLTPEMRQLTGTVTGGTMPGTSLDFTTYTAVFGTAADTFPPGDPDNIGFGYPGTNPTNVQIGLQRNKYISFRFRAPSNPIWQGVVGSFLVIPGNAFTLASISPCPGQFKSDTNFPNNLACHIVGKQSNLNWDIPGPVTARCQLQPGETYYLNLINASFPDLTQSTCPSSTCSPKVNLQGGQHP